MPKNFASAMPHMNKRHWISVDFEGDVPDSLHRELIAHAYRQTAKGLTLKIRRELSLI